LEKILEDVKDEKTPEYIFFNRLVKAIFITNVFAICILIVFIFIFSKKIISPIEKTTSLIKDLKLGKDFRIINYSKKDEI
jgi:hypothetical protein